MHFSDDSHMVRVDFFKRSGKWYTTEAVRWLFYGTEPFIKCPTYKDIYSSKRQENEDAIYLDMHDIFALSLYKHCETRLSDLQAVCLNPYHVFEHPLSITGWVEKAKTLINDHPILKEKLKIEE